MTKNPPLRPARGAEVTREPHSFYFADSKEAKESRFSSTYPQEQEAEENYIAALVEIKTALFIRAKQTRLLPPRTHTVAHLAHIPRDENVNVPALDVWVSKSWEELEQYLGIYRKTTYQVSSVRTATPVRTRNAGIEESANPGNKIAEEFEHYSKTFVCTQNGRPRRSRSNGNRPHQHSRKVGCPDPGGSEIFITKHITQHNHEVSSDAYEHYHEGRRISDDEVMCAPLGRKKILEYIREDSSVDPSMKDVHNLAAKLTKESYNLPMIEERVRAILEDFAENPGNNMVDCVYIQSSHMRQMCQHFSEVLLIDAMHDTNSSNYKLFSFMIHDAMGKGQRVQCLWLCTSLKLGNVYGHCLTVHCVECTCTHHFLLENERKETLRMSCTQFKANNPSYDSLAVIIVDKDFTEISVLEEEFPGVRILLCHVHVVKYLQEEVAKEKYNLDKKEMKRFIQLLVSTPSENGYDDIIATMKVVLRSGDKIRLWFDYFDRNWVSCKER
ncbi:LOW QUALITY PROTEIN: hypothetical protein PHMEG_0001258 [Phytophthora megakarya]|uniref:ZSWIM1/3 RNaseH-like domain-containing protein n=1 Tax=Phytophthora megakarya TaxID=4795 RepID=A0A225X3L1_9STRA|nr:LOW QUALITY PROTEIN: hypothetical protein PHMEG_0001258 [Phytophthora megakarya]